MYDFDMNNAFKSTASYLCEKCAKNKHFYAKNVVIFLIFFKYFFKF